ncbi:hypothetical protein [Capybara microvirus Cap3_SP_450]|nr:hypothetical protein [Capybara microvirus Cap3_SP_450]
MKKQKLFKGKEIKVERISEKEMYWGIPYGIYKEREYYYTDLDDNGREIGNMEYAENDEEGIKKCIKNLECLEEINKYYE